MISIGGVIGTGLFLGTGSALMNGGPLGLLLGYMFIGSICYCVMITIGEMISYLPIAGGHIKLAERFVDPAFSFALGWNLWYNWTVTLPGTVSESSCNEYRSLFPSRVVRSRYHIEFLAS